MVSKHNIKLGFLHIPRTGGTYLESVLQQLGPEQFINFFGTPHNQIQNKITLIERIERDLKVQQVLKNNPNWRSCKLFSGHFSHNIERFVEGEVKFFTILRDPIQRVTSFVKRITTSRGFQSKLSEGTQEVGDEQFWKNFESYVEQNSKQFLLTHERHGFSNYMTKAIAGLDLSSEDLVVDEEVLDKAKENLDKMVYVGAFESYNKTVIDVLSLFNLDAKFTSQDLKISKVPSTTENLLRSLNFYDIELYNYFLNK